VLQFDAPLPQETGIPGILQSATVGNTLEIAVCDFSDETVSAAKLLHPRALTVEDMGLEDIFVAMVGEGKE
jgi:hypothetical protein